MNENVTSFVLERCGNFFNENFAGSPKVARGGIWKGLQEMALSSISKLGREALALYGAMVWKVIPSAVDQ